MKWFAWAALAAVLFWVWKSNRKRYAGMVLTGWGGGPTGFVPAMVDPTATVGNGPQAAVFGGPGVPYGPSRSTNLGSGGGHG
jgi:hypothetical protein